MTSTSLKNSPLMYKVEQAQINNYHINNMYKGRILHKENYLPDLGINGPCMFSGYNNNILSDNAPDIESTLFGIGSSNLVEPKAPVYGKMNKLENIKFFECKPTSNNLIPEPLVVSDQERFTIFRR